MTKLAFEKIAAGLNEALAAASASPVVLALDLASVSGWAVGRPGAEPEHGSIRFASPGASHEAIFAKAELWINQKIDQFAPGLIVWEAPIPTSFRRGMTTSNTTTLLYGLPAIIGAAAYLRGIYDIRKADTRDVRHHFIGSNPKRAKAKPLVMRQCRAKPIAEPARAAYSALFCCRVLGWRPATCARLEARWHFVAGSLKCPIMQRLKALSGIALPSPAKPCYAKAVRPSRT